MHPAKPPFSSPLAPPGDVDDEDDDDAEVDDDAHGEDVVPPRRGEHALHDGLVVAVLLFALLFLQLGVAVATQALQKSAGLSLGYLT